MVECDRLLLLYRFLEGAHGFGACNIYRKDTTRFLAKDPTVEVELVYGKQD